MTGAACLILLGSPSVPVGSRASMGRQEAIWRGRKAGFVSRVGFPGPALGNMLSQLGALCCVVYVFMVFWREQRGGEALVSPAAGRA